jgi:hypothetical protein
MHARFFTRLPLAAVGASLICTLSAVQARAQSNGFGSNGFGTAIHGVPPSVTSFGFGGSPGFHGLPPSVTSLGFGNTPFRIHSGPFGFRHSHRGFGFANPFFGNVFAVPYAYPAYVMEPGVDDSMEEEDYRGGPTIFDRRGPGTDEYGAQDHRSREARRREHELRDQEEDYRAELKTKPQPQESVQPQEVTEQPRTVLVFKDGHELEVANYAIVGSTLYDLSDNRARKVALAELDLSATVKHNDDRGVDFRLPSATRAN